MKIAIIQAASQKDKNLVIEHCLRQSVDLSKNEIINFGVFPEEECEITYVQTAFCISMLLESRAVDFVVTGCSSGQGMMLACNSLPGILCGYVENPSDAYLFGRINNGNAVSFPLGLNFGWAGEINLKATLQALFSEPFGMGYPKEDAKRKRKDTEQMKRLNYLTKKTLVTILPLVEEEFLKAVFQRQDVCNYVLEQGTNKELVEVLSGMLKNYEAVQNSNASKGLAMTD
ncbi:MAG: sugar phosphate isomerase [Lachnospiraceae bacterium]|nr:sugar phosphate isomerase [Lachnospiraceae bacterium]